MPNIVVLLWIISAFVIGIGVLITVHEFGHFFVARCCGVSVVRFSIGFGPKLLSFVDKKGTEFILACIPLGGSVRMLNSNKDTLTTAQARLAFDNKNIMRRAAIISAGPIANFLLAILLYTFGYLWGVPTTAPVVASVVQASLLQQAGMPNQSKIDAINGVATANWQSVIEVLTEQRSGKVVNITYSSLRSPAQHVARFKMPAHEKDNLLQVMGLIPYQTRVQPKVAAITPNSAAYLAKIKVGDVLLDINGTPICSWENFTQFVRQHPNESVNLRLDHLGDIRNISLKLGSVVEQGKIVGFLGVVPQVDFSQLPVVKYNVIDSFTTALGMTWSFLKLSVESVYKLIVGHFQLAQLAGPVSIAKGAGQSAYQGIVPYVFYLGFISISVGVFNLLPLPILDGGHLFFMLIEKIKGKPLSERVQEISFRVGAILLLLIIALALFNDFSQLF